MRPAGTQDVRSLYCVPCSWLNFANVVALSSAIFVIGILIFVKNVGPAADLTIVTSAQCNARSASHCPPRAAQRQILRAQSLWPTQPPVASVGFAKRIQYIRRPLGVILACGRLMFSFRRNPRWKDLRAWWSSHLGTLTHTYSHLER